MDKKQSRGCFSDWSMMGIKTFHSFDSNEEWRRLSVSSSLSILHPTLHHVLDPQYFLRDSHCIFPLILLPPCPLPPGVDNVVSALLPHPQINHAFVGGDKEKPLPAAEPGLSAWPLARGGFKRVGARGFLSLSRQDNPRASKQGESPVPHQASAARVGSSKPGCSGPPTYPHTLHNPQTQEPPGLQGPKKADTAPVINSGDGGKASAAAAEGRKLAENKIKW